MIFGLGTDIVNVSRLEESINKFGDSFITRCFTEVEIKISKDKPDRNAFFAKRFAAKEAFFKALGTGFTNKVSWQDVEVFNDDLGKPGINVSGKSMEILEQKAPNYKIHLSISDDAPFAMATVIIESIK